MVTRSVASSAEAQDLVASPRLRWYPPVKRALDVAVAVSVLGLAASLPLWLIIAAAILLEDGSPVFFRRAVGGRGGQSFTLVKFRTMTHRDHPGADIDPTVDHRLTRGRPDPPDRKSVV